MEFIKYSYKKFCVCLIFSNVNKNKCHYRRYVYLSCKSWNLQKIN